MNIATNSPGINPIAVESMKRLQEPVEGYLTVDEIKGRLGISRWSVGWLCRLWGSQSRYKNCNTYLYFLCAINEERNLYASIMVANYCHHSTSIDVYFWGRRVGKCETNNVHVNAIVADGAPTNKRFFSILHGGSYTIREGVLLLQTHTGLLILFLFVPIPVIYLRR
uniref:uncharacterized protein LOC108950631 isoform X2 n=1 Tax=Ciona intestinalis TaxID=7719 RepID=UPI000EF529EA|nr:uncharacterized protein LOC108950631 isoform X2 [Ciona intestinalis]|eukprot:XP_026695391.1 uncharacterized protein LOC108950631 isoform X2 [Ciona intestinalis]